MTQPLLEARDLVMVCPGQWWVWPQPSVLASPSLPTHTVCPSSHLQPRCHEPPPTPGWLFLLLPGFASLLGKRVPGSGSWPPIEQGSESAGILVRVPGNSMLNSRRRMSSGLIPSMTQPGKPHVIITPFGVQGLRPRGSVHCLQHVTGPSHGLASLFRGQVRICSFSHSFTHQTSSGRLEHQIPGLCLVTLS